MTLLNSHTCNEPALQTFCADTGKLLIGMHFFVLMLHLCRSNKNWYCRKTNLARAFAIKYSKTSL